MNIQQAHAGQGESACHGSRDCVGNVMKLQVEEDVRAKLVQFLNG
jgi:hypothetical protein